MNSISTETRFFSRRVRRRSARGSYKQKVLTSFWSRDLLTDKDVEEFLEPSDEEVLAASEVASTSEEDFDDAQDISDSPHDQPGRPKSGRIPRGSDSEASAAPEEDEDTGGWGTSRKDYYNADPIQTEADALEEEAEARRLQQKQLQGMTEADFGFDEVDWLETGKEDEGVEGDVRGKIIREVLPKVEITDAMGSEERLKILRNRYPEFEPLAKEFLDLQPVYDELETAATEATMVKDHSGDKAKESVELEERPTPFIVIKHSILAAYLASLSMYFAILTSSHEESGGKPIAMPPEELRDHTIMETLVQTRDLWQKVKDMVVSEPNGLYEIETRSTSEQADVPKVNDIPKTQRNGEDRHKKRKHRKSKAQKATEAAQAEAEALHAEKLRKAEASLADLSSLTTRPKPLSKSPNPSTSAPKPHDDSSSDFGEATTLTPHEAAEKASRKKSLRFYTSQITQKANKRGTAGRDAGGDADIPYRERLKDRQARLNAEAEKRGKKPKSQSQGDDLGGLSDEEDHAIARELRNGNGGEVDYYDLIASRSASKKASKAAAVQTLTSQLKSNIDRNADEETVGEDGKRGISYQIEKNKGITPKRKKEVRNPRVKKRKKFEDKKKKLGSVRAVWKGGEGRGGYGGELTGIKKGLVKSVKL